MLGLFTAQARAAEERLKSQTFSLGTATLALSLPANAAISTSDGPHGREVTFDLTKGRRLVRYLRLGTEEVSIEGDREALRHGGDIVYTVVDDAGGGSGGPIGELRGRLTVGGRSFSVLCTDQDEWGPQPEWCLRYLHEIREVKP